MRVFENNFASLDKSPVHGNVMKMPWTTWTGSPDKGTDRQAYSLEDEFDVVIVTFWPMHRVHLVSNTL